MKELRAEDKILSQVKKIHMIGIGGSGMCPLAQILKDKGYIITGSDNNESEPLSRIKKLGIKVTMGHFAENVHSCELVVYSAAISKDNPELVEAERLSIPTMERSVLLGALTRYYDNVIGVCGTHGKTSVTSMITQILYLNKMDPTAVIGGKLPILNSNGRIGKSEIMVCEACEFVDTFLKMSPDISVLLNIDNDHLDYFKTMENLVASFRKFVGMSKIAYVNGDDSLVLDAVDNYNGQIVSFGMNKNNDFYADNISAGKRGFSFDVFKNGDFIVRINLSIPGKHNVYNGLAAFAVCYDLGVEPMGIVEALEKFTGAGRRFEFLGEYGGYMIADDYAHHPTEIKATLSAAKALPYSKVTCIFQPFTFSRTALLKEEFIDALSLADEVVLTEIMGSREINTYGISSEQIAEKLPNARVIKTFDEIADYIYSTARNNQLVITMGGGDIYKAAHKLIKKY
ncbi:MAG: UDP-N-acetylmuramate--L-alanine ligase [Acutalibacteraceae bacterium]|nr:UDP-N-acetylmuramate--L-alanine ligase [Acutalibacteraceae bacterium]